MLFQVITSVTNKEFGIGFFIKKESILSSYKYSLYLKVFWFKLGFRFFYNEKWK